MSEPQGTVMNPHLYDATNQELEKFLVVSLAVAGKTARIQQGKVDQLYENLFPEGMDKAASFFTAMVSRSDEDMRAELEKVKLGQYIRMVKAYRALGDLMGRLSDDWLRVVTREQLADIPGISWKTASMFIMFSRLEVNDVACLDTHILWFMRNEMKIEDTPKASPQKKEVYEKFEKIFVDWCHERGHRVADKDFEIWLSRQRMQNKPTTTRL